MFLIKDFNVTIINMLIDRKKSIEGLRENFNKSIEELQKSHSELRNIVTEITYAMEGMNICCK